jgi:hypothetical protein
MGPVEGTTEDLYATLAFHYHWTPAEIDAMDPDRLETIVAYLDATIEKRRADEAKEKARAAFRR